MDNIYLHTTVNIYLSIQYFPSYFSDICNIIIKSLTADIYFAKGSWQHLWY